MELRALKYFISVYENGSISAAARNCFVSQPSITAAIQQLEHTLDITLFVRHARGVLPTAAADKLYPAAINMRIGEQSIKHLFSDGPTPVPFRIGIMRSLGSRRMSYLLKKINEKIENLELTLVDPEEPCDARVVLSQSITSNELFIPLWQDHYKMALPATSLLAKKSILTVQDLDGLPFINRTPCDALEKIKALMAKAAVSFQPRANIRTIEYAWQLVNAEIGAALLPNWQEIEDDNGLILKDIKDVELTKHIGLAYKTSQQHSALIVAVKEICHDSFA